jgi:glucan biosynthesis protein C
MLAIIGVLFFHSAMPFTTDDWWHLKNKETSNLMLEFNFWLSRFRMPLLFFVSGAVTSFILKRKTAGQFVGMRFKRLFIPLLFGMLVVVPPQIYLERKTQGFTGSFFEFFPSIFSGEPYPAGNTSWHHLWFIAYLFVYNLISAPLLAFLVRRGPTGMARAMTQLAKGRWIYLLIIPSVILFTWLVPLFDQTNDLIHDWAFHPYWFLFFFTGFLCIRYPELSESLEINRRLSAFIGIATFIAINYFRWNNLEPWDNGGWKHTLDNYLLLSLRPVSAWFWVLALIGYGKKYLNRPHRSLQYINEIIYPFYILHQTIIVIIAYYVLQTTDTILLKYLFIVLSTFAVSMFLIHFVIRPVKFLRFVFGMKG